MKCWAEQAEQAECWFENSFEPSREYRRKKEIDDVMNKVRNTESLIAVPAMGYARQICYVETLHGFS